MDEITIDLHARRKIEEGLRQLDEGQGIPHAELNRRFVRSVLHRNADDPDKVLMSAITARRYTLEEYFDLERSRDFKSEYYRGEIFAMSGGSFWHSRIGANVLKVLGVRLDAGPCQPCNSDMKIRCETGLYTYPDASVVCGDPHFEGSRSDVLLNPRVLFEVLSPSTEAYDRGKKYEHYMTIPSLRDYVLIPQDRPCVSRISRSSDDSPWTISIFEGLSAFLEIPSIGITIPLAEIYAKVEFPPETPSSGSNGIPEA